MVGLLLLSHSPKLVEGLRDVASEMAKGLTIHVAGGNAAGGLGSDYDLIKEALLKAYNPDGLIVLYDLGSTAMTAELVMDEMDDGKKESIRIMKAPLVEGTIVAAVEISSGADLEAVVEVLSEMEIIK